MTEGGAGAGPASGVPAGRLPGRGVRTSTEALAGAALRAARPVVSAQTWLAVIHLMAGLVTGALAFAVVVVLGVLGITTLWFFLLGLPVLVAALWLGLQFGRAERARFAVTLGEQIPAPPAELSLGARHLGRMWRLLTSRKARAATPRTR